MAIKPALAVPPFKVKKSKIHGTGVFATRPIRKGTRVAEYTGDRVTHAEADRRYEHRPIEDNHTFLFIVDSRAVIDGGSNGGAARFINHSCDPNCEAVTDQRRIFIESLRGIKKGEELAYDYQITRDRGDPADIDEIFACRCGARKCRGSMLELKKAPKPRKKKVAAKKTAGQKAAGKKKKSVKRRARA